MMTDTGNGRLYRGRIVGEADSCHAFAQCSRRALPVLAQVLAPHYNSADTRIPVATVERL